MFFLPKKIVIFVVILGSMSLTSCLTPEDRAIVYGGSKPPEKSIPEIVQPEPDEPNDSESIVYQPPKAAPTIPVTTAPVTSIPGLRSVDGHVTSPADRPMAQDTCGASKYIHLLGQPLASLNTLSFQQQIRILMPGQVVTQDYNAKRLNFDVAKADNIQRLWCG